MTDRVALHPAVRSLPLDDDRLALVELTAGGFAVAHRCKEVGVGDRLVCDPALVDHTVTGEWPAMTVRPSVLCPDCGLHGFITDGRWSPA